MANLKRTIGAMSRKMPPGPYVAKVVSHLDPRRGGALRVELLSNVTEGNKSLEPGELFTARYCMPFYGVTNVETNTKN